MGVYSPATPVPLMMAFLVITGFFQSIFWTATNAFTFADIDDKDAGQANVISQVGVQLSLAFGVALGGGVLEAGAAARMAASRCWPISTSPSSSSRPWRLISTVMFLRLPQAAPARISPAAHRQPARRSRSRSRGIAQPLKPLATR